MRIRSAPIESLTVDGHVFAVRWSRRRRTIGLTVARDGDLRVLAPVGVPARKLEGVARAKLPWVRRKLAEFEALGPPPAPKRFVEGERLPYLGRTYRLTIVAGAATPFALRRGRFELRDGLEGAVRDAAVAWYVARARERLRARVEHFCPLVGATPADLDVRDLGVRRWGACDARAAKLSLHWELVLQPPEIIDYVVVHELAHLHEPNHGRAFWRRVEQVLPDWRTRRAWLAAHGQRHVI